MPEIAEISRIVHFLRTYLKNRKVAHVQFQDDQIVYGKVGTSGAAFASALTGKTVLDARQQGKYFWLVMSSPPHPLMHFGMSGWLKFSHDKGASVYKAGSKKTGLETEAEEKGSWIDAVEGAAEWPPKYWKFILQMEGSPHVEAAFVDARRLGRIRLIDVPAEEMRKTSPLKENGPDPVIDKDILTVAWLKEKVESKRVPIKALLLDQANISGVGNWVGDEVLYNAKIHPEQYSNTLKDAQVKQLHKSLMYICDTACELLADSDKFPKDWLMKHRWSKGKKGENYLPNGEKIVHLTVGGRTSAVVPTVQKKTGPVAGDLNEDTKVGAEEHKAPATNEVKKPAPKEKLVERESDGISEVAKSGSSKVKSKKRRNSAVDAPASDKKETSSKKAKGHDKTMTNEALGTESPLPRRTSSRVTRSSTK